MPAELATHTLVRIAGARSLEGAGVVPSWAWAALRRAPWVVVRRVAMRDGLIPVGVRGPRRSERLAAWLHPEAVLECLTPPELAARRAWRLLPRRGRLPALAMLEKVETIMRDRRLAGAWGPCGGVAFELASGVATVTAQSDLDLMVRADAALARAAAAELASALSRLAVRVDVLLEFPHGALALAEYGGACTPLLLRTREGPRLVHDPWPQAGAAR
ncbi:MAG TPA: malonate decarboxylase holo-ACP synthase [Steroidobacteraceae bacterium]|nr:malonate decarboxylase holo-ACP synthase [Steroidobacteraceae bacterium]